MVAGLQGSFAGQAAVHLAVRLGLGGDPEAVWDWLQQLLSDGVIVGAVLDDQRLGEPAIDIGAPGSTLWAAADGFAQACEAGHTRLPALVADAALGLLTNQPEASSQTPPLSHLTELYAGSGNLTRALRPLTRKLLAVEGDADATQRLRRLLLPQQRGFTHQRLQKGHGLVVLRGHGGQDLGFGDRAQGGGEIGRAHV